MTKFLFIDTETLGLDPTKHSLIEVAMVLTDENLNTLDVFHYKIKHEIYHLNPAAIAVNGIDMSQHDRQASPLWNVRTYLRDFLSTLDDEAIPVGWNVGFDLGFIYANMLPKEELERYVSYRTIDLCSVARFMKLCGKLDNAGSLAHTARKLGIDNSKVHTALGDVEMTIEVMRKLKELM